MTQPPFPPPPPVDPNAGNNAFARMLLPIHRSPWAIAAGYLGLFAIIVYPAPLALIAGIVAVRDLRRHPEKHGMGRAVFGILAGAVGSAFLLNILLT